MKPRLLSPSLTLLELLIALALVGVVVLAFFGLDIFSRYHVVTSDRRAKVQNEASYVLEHMSKEIGKAAGNERSRGSNSVVNVTGSGIIRINTDSDNNGQADRWIAYFLSGYQIQYCSHCTDNTCTSCNTANETLSRYVTNFTPVKPQCTANILTDNYVSVNLTACWDPDGSPSPCGSPDNPNVTMQTRIKMPAVSTN